MMHGTATRVLILAVVDGKLSPKQAGALLALTM
jgi:anti-sigma factor RsiW